MVQEERFTFESDPMHLSHRDEFIHTAPADSSHWREGYHFNGYDPVNSIGLSINKGFNPSKGWIEEIVMVYSSSLYILQKRIPMEDNLLDSGSILLFPRIPFQTWDILIDDFFNVVQHGYASSNLHKITIRVTYEACDSPFAYTTSRGDRYEQPGILTGTVTEKSKDITISAPGIRDHSWEKRDIHEWNTWFALMGNFNSGKALNIAVINRNNKTESSVWLKSKAYHSSYSVKIKKDFNNQLLISSNIELVLKNFNDSIHTYNTHMKSFVILSPTKNNTAPYMVESLVDIESESEKGFGFLWYGNRNQQ